jgi:hypothetical protein
MNGRDLKLVAYVVIGAGFVLVTLGRLVYNDFFGTSELIVWAPRSGDAALSLDGDAPIAIPAGTSRVLEASRGKHEIVSTVNGEKYSVSVKLGAGGAQYAVPTTAHQCFAVADVSRMYTYSSFAKSDPARVESRLVDHAAAKLPKVTFAGAAKMPYSTKRKGAIYVLQELDCDDMKVGDATLLGLMGLSS